MSEQASPTFSPRVVLAMVLLGAGAFLALLWMIGSGMTSGSTNNGEAHAGSKGLTGYAALADLLERRGHTVRLSRSEAALDDPGLLVLTPQAGTKGADLARIVEARRRIGPTLLITPKWIAGGLPQGTPGAQKGWVQLWDARLPEWPGFLDDVVVAVGPMNAKDKRAGWAGRDVAGTLPVADAVLSATGPRLEPLVIGQQDGRILAAYVNDGGMYPNLEEMAVEGPMTYGEDEDIYPLVVVFEPDLFNNYGMADEASARLADQLIDAAAENAGPAVTFDLTLNGFARSANLLTLAFTPPYLAATLCLLLAALAVGWRAFLRFGPAARGGRAIAFGKTALVANAAGLIRRAGRLHLVGAPYADAARERLARALALPRMADAAATEAAIDRALAARRGRDGRGHGAMPNEAFSLIAARLRAARRAPDMLRAAQDLHALERTLTR